MTSGAADDHGPVGQVYNISICFVTALKNSTAVGKRANEQKGQRLSTKARAKSALYPRCRNHSTHSVLSEPLLTLCKVGEARGPGSRGAHVGYAATKPLSAGKQAVDLAAHCLVWEGGPKVCSDTASAETRVVSRLLSPASATGSA